MNDILFPPFMPSKQNGFLFSESGRIYFNISQFNAINQVNHIQVAINRQDNNLNGLPTNLAESTSRNVNYGSNSGMSYQLGLLFLKKESIKYDDVLKTYYIDLPTNLLLPSIIYKVQVRLGTKAVTFDSTGVKIENVLVDASWISKAENLKSLSEWSSVGVFKTLNSFNLEIQGMESGVLNKVKTTVYTFVGMSFLNQTNEDEILESTKFTLYHNGVELENSGKIPQPASQKTYNYYTFEEVYTSDKEYEVEFTVYTKSGFSTSIRRRFSCSTILNKPTYYLEIDNNTLGMTNSQINLAKTGTRLVLKDQGYQGREGQRPNSYVIRRTSSRSNFEKWEEVVELRISDQAPVTALVEKRYFDTFVEAGVTYRYAVQSKLLNTGRGLVSDYIEFTPNFEYSWLIGQDKLHLNISYNLGLSNYKTVIKESLVETIGGKYPFFVRNGNVRYKQFSLNGMITKDMDVEKKLYKDGNVEDYVLEREFRNSLENLFLDGKAKVFKTDTEGLMIVYLSNVSLTPEQSLGRTIYSFSCQVTEIADFTLENLVKYELLNINPDKDAIADIWDIAVVGYANMTKPLIGKVISGVY